MTLEVGGRAQQKELLSDCSPAAPLPAGGLKIRSASGSQRPTSLCAKTLGDALPRRVAASRGHLAAYLRSYFQAEAPSKPARTGPLPCPLLYAEGRSPEAARGLEAQMPSDERGAARWGNLAVAGLNFLFCGFSRPHRPPAAERGGRCDGEGARIPSVVRPRRMTKSEQLLARSVGRFVGPWVRRGRGVVSALGRFREKFEDSASALESIKRKVDRMKDELREPESSGGLPKTAKPDRKPGKRARALVLESSKLKFELGPSFDGEKCLDDPDLAAILVVPRTAQMPPKLWPGPIAGEA